MSYLRQSGSVGRKLFLYVCLNVALTIALSFLLTSVIRWSRVPIFVALPAFCIFILASSLPATAIINRCVTTLFKPHRLPREKDFTLSANSATLVVVPALIQSTENSQRLISDLKTRFIANPDRNVRYALVTDYQDSLTRELPQDESLLSYIVDEISRLNARHDDSFFLLHRDRQWNPHERIWMGHERKRGKLAALNVFLCSGGRDSTFSTIVGDKKWLATVIYVITLDADTRLLPGVVNSLVATMESSGNKPHYDCVKRRIVQGYGVLQPRPVQLPLETAPTRYQLIFCDEFQPLSHGVLKSDIFQDLFGEGSFYGKGIYNVKAFERALANRIPCNQVLSHDLLEGCYARSGIVSDVVFPEEYPQNLHADLKRRHRWTRGDWQLGPWLLPYVLNEHGTIEHNPISFLGKWKILDNLRRTLLPIAFTISFLLGWFYSPTPMLWTALIFGLLFLPALLTFSFTIRRVERTDNLNELPDFYPFFKELLRAWFRFIFLIHESLVLSDAIFRALWRMLVSRRRLLDWLPSYSSTTSGTPTFFESVRRMKFSLFAVIAIAAALSHFEPQAFSSAIPVLSIWGFAPVIAWWLGQPLCPTAATGNPLA